MSPAKQPAKTSAKQATKEATKQPAKEAAKRPRKKAAVEDVSAEEALRRRAEEADHILDFVDRTSLGGSEEDITGELSTADQHPADTSDITFQRELDLTVRGIAEARKHQIEEALARQRDGTYGICEECGQPIDPERLRARPEATTCIECARHQEGVRHP